MATANYQVIARRMVPQLALLHAGEHAVCVILESGHMAWGFGSDWQGAERDAVQSASALTQPAKVRV